LSRAWRDRLLEHTLPRRGHVDAEAPGIRRSRLQATDDARGLVIGRVVAVSVDRRGAHLQPDTRWPRRRRDGIADDARAAHTRVLDHATILGRVAAVDAAPGEIDDDVRAVEIPRPGAEVPGVPGDHTPGGFLRCSAENDDVMSVRMQGAGEDSADL